jgi:hypothetical protein
MNSSTKRKDAQASSSAIDSADRPRRCSEDSNDARAQSDAGLPVTWQLPTRVLRALGYRHARAPLELRRVISAWRKSFLPAIWQGSIFANIERLCLFLGYPRSGHSLVGALLDAHPEIVIAHEEDILQYLQFPVMRVLFNRAQLFNLLLTNSRECAARGRRGEGSLVNEFTYQVPGQYQGTFTRLRVIGDKKGGGTTIRIRRNGALLAILNQMVGVEIRYVHVVRNPYDNIATMARKHKTTLQESSEVYFRLCRTNAKFRTRLAATVIDVRHEALIAQPHESLRRLCSFLGLSAEPSYLKACANLVYDQPHKSRNKAKWPEFLKAEIQARIAEFDFLEGYTFDT